MADGNIFQRMLKATAEISTVAKNLDVGYGKNKYKAVGESDVLEAVKPIEEKWGIYSYPVSRKVIDSNIISFKNSEGQERTNTYLRIETVYRFVNVDKPEEYLDITTYGDGIDSQDKAPGKAMTYGDKYALLKAYKIRTGEDPDANESEEGTARLYKSSSAQSVPTYRPKEGPVAQQEPAYPPKSEMLTAINSHYPEGKVRDNLLKALSVESIDKLSDAQVIAIYNKVTRK